MFRPNPRNLVSKVRDPTYCCVVRWRLLLLHVQLEEEEEEEGNSEEEEEEDEGSSQQSRVYVPPKVVATPYGMYV